MKMLKKLIPAVLISASMILGMTACSGDKGGDLAKIQEKKKIVLGTSADFPPFEFVDSDKNYVGLDLDIAKEIADDLGVELEVNNMQFDALITALSANKVDIILSGMNPTPEREEEVDFSDIYFESTHYMVIRKEDEGTIKEESDLKGKKIGVQMGSTQENIVKEKFEDSEIQSLSTIPDLMMLLESGKVDAVVTEDAVAENYIGDKLIHNGIVYEGDEGVAVAMRKNNKELVEKINATIKRLKDEGKIDEYYQKAIELAQENK